MKILVDVDGVVADLHSEWLRKYNEEYNDTLTNDMIKKWGLHEYVKPECGSKIYDYLRDEDLYDRVPVIEGAKEGVEWLRSKGHTIIFVSAGFYTSKVRWLSRTGLAIDYRYKGRDNAWETLSDVVLCGNKNLIRGDVLIDDYQGNLRDFDGRRVLFTQPWNTEESGYIRVGSWTEVIGWISAMELGFERENRV